MDAGGPRARTRVALHAAFVVGDIDRRLFGSFVEHMGRCVYTGVFESGHPTATREGFRQDVLDLTREMGVSAVRYPGGNFVSGYRWEDGVGPRAGRPARLDLAWRSVEPNTFGLHEFVAWARQAAVQPIVAVNLGTRGVQEAADLVEYCNHPGGTALSDLRRSHAAALADELGEEHARGEPFGVRTWCLGNEMDGPWQIGHKTPQEYGRVAAETAKAMRLVDPDIELVACGSSNHGMPTFGRWEEEVLDHTFDVVDYISLHAYYEKAGDLTSFLASAVDMDSFIEDVVATADAVAARRRSSRRLRLSFDEWNVWNQSDFVGADRLDWAQAPALIEDTYDVADAVVVGSFLMSLLRHADRVGIACQAQLANIIAPIRTEAAGPSWRQSTFHPFAHTARLARGQVLKAAVDSPRHHTERYGDVETVDVLATSDPADGSVTVFLVNRSETEEQGVDVDLAGFGPLEVAEHIVLADEDFRAVSTLADPDRVVTRAGSGARSADGRLSLELPPVSWTALRLTLARR